MTTLGPRSATGARDTRRAERARDAGDRARVLGAVEDLERALHLELGVRRHGVDVARLARRSVARLAAAAGARGARSVDDSGGSVQLGGDRAGRAPALGALGELGRRRALAALAQPPEQRARRGRGARRARRQLVAAALADPALVRRAAVHSSQTSAPRAAGEERLGVLAAQQRAAADVAGDVAAGWCVISRDDSGGTRRRA